MWVPGFGCTRHRFFWKIPFISTSTLGTLGIGVLTLYSRSTTHGAWCQAASELLDRFREYHLDSTIRVLLDAFQGYELWSMMY